MNAEINATDDPTTPLQKFGAAMSGFGFACMAFFFSATVLVPITGRIAESLAVPDLVTATVVLFELFGLTVIAGIAGVAAFARGLAIQSLDQAPSSH
ncbi:MAG: hypothetical protein AAGA03_17210 [Planctomycetota bacterium]